MMKYFDVILAAKTNQKKWLIEICGLKFGFGPI